MTQPGRIPVGLVLTSFDPGGTERQMTELITRRSALLQKFTPLHPAVQAVEAQLAAVNERLRAMPEQERRIADIARELRLNEELYTTLAKRAADIHMSLSANAAATSNVVASV